MVTPMMRRQICVQRGKGTSKVVVGKSAVVAPRTPVVEAELTVEEEVTLVCYAAGVVVVIMGFPLCRHVLSSRA